MTAPLCRQQHREEQSRPVVEVQASMVSSSCSSSSSSSSSSSESYQYLSTAPTSNTSTKPSAAARPTSRPQRPRRREDEQQQQQQEEQEDDHPLTITYFPPSISASVSSVDTYDSLLSDPDPDNPLADSDDDGEGEGDEAAPRAIRLPAAGDASIPAALPPYRAAAADPALRPSDPYTFARLFPSLDRLAVRHDDATADGNMNLRVETVVGPGPLLGRSRRAATVQLFHLRMHDLARRDFSLRRYCRDSGREVCFSKRAYAAPSGGAAAAAAATGGLTRSVSAALRSVTTPFRRSAASSSNASSSSRRSSSSVSRRRPSVVAAAVAAGRGSTATAHSGRSSASSSLSLSSLRPSAASLLVPTDTIKLEFSNYARVDVCRRRRGKRYDFEWWGRSYAWRRAVDETLGTVSFHLVRDGEGSDPVAHIVPEVRSPSQVEAEERAGGWIPPCYMWISDQSIVEAVTDVADVIVATGLVALVDDCIRQRWQAKKPAPLFPARPHISATDADGDHSKTGIRGFFSRRPSTQHSHSPLRLGRTVAVY